MNEHVDLDEMDLKVATTFASMLSSMGDSMDALVADIMKLHDQYQIDMAAAANAYATRQGQLADKLRQDVGAVERKLRAISQSLGAT